MLYDTSYGWRHAVMVWEVAVPYWLLTLTGYTGCLAEQDGPAFPSFWMK